MAVGRWVLGVGIVAALAMAGFRVHAWYRAKYVPHGTLTAAQALALSRPLFTAVTGHRDDTTLTAVRAATHVHANHRKFWIVYCEGPSNSLLGYAVIDGDRGEAVAVTDTYREEPRGRMRPLSVEQALLAAKSWMKDLGAAATRRWKLSAEPERTRQGWTFSWKAGLKTARVVVNPNTGEVVNANFHHSGANERS
jgi:hypothetical protein